MEDEHESEMWFLPRCHDGEKKIYRTDRNSEIDGVRDEGLHLLVVLLPSQYVLGAGMR